MAICAAIEARTCFVQEGVECIQKAGRKVCS